MIYARYVDECNVADPDPYVLGILDPDQEPLVRGMDPDPDHSITKQKKKKNLDSYCFVTSY
jgi:hypothetical protein